MLARLLPWKKKKQDEDEEEDAEENGSEEKKSKQSRSTSRRKKQPSKPWGKRERILVLAVLLFTIGASGLASLKSTGFRIPDLKMGNLDLSELNPFQEETIVLYGTQNQEKDPNELIDQIIDKTRFLQGEYAFAVLRLDTGFKYGVNGDNIMPAASLVKLPVMAAMYKAEENGELEFYDEYLLKESDKQPGSGSLISQPAGYRIRYQELVELMGKQSDNTAYKIAKDLVGSGLVAEVLQDAQMQHTDIDRNETTAEDIALFFYHLWKGDPIQNNHRDEMLDHLTDTIYENWISKGVPGQIKVAHKYGTLDGVVNDAGIVFATDPYVLVVLSENVSREEANIVIPEISRMVYDFEIGS